MAYTTINKSTDYFNTITYTGNGTSNTNRTVGGFEPDWIWVKNRSSTDSHYLMDKVRGLDYNIETDTSAAQVRDYLISSASGFNGWISSNSGEVNANNATYVAWNWKANGAGSTNTAGSINSTVSVSATSGFSIVKYTGTGSDMTVGHGLNAVPKMIILKALSTGSDPWWVYHASLGNSAKLRFNETNASATSADYIWNQTTPTSSVFSLDGANNGSNASGNNFIAYCFAEKTGYSKFDSYIGNGNANGAFIYLGFKPAFVMVKKTSGTGNWYINDTKRDPYNRATHSLFPNLYAVENATGWFVDYVSNGFKIRDTGSEVNASGGTYIYMAFAEAPLVGTNNVPCTAR